MSAAERAKSLGLGVLGLAALLAFIVIPVCLLAGAATFSLWILKWTFPAFLITLATSLLIATPLALIPPTRILGALGFLIASIAFGAILWIWAMAYTYTVWGLFAVIVGFALLGIGVVPIALLAALIHGDWGNLGLFVATGILTVVLRALANWLEENANGRATRLARLGRRSQYRPEATAYTSVTMRPGTTHTTSRYDQALSANAPDELKDLLGKLD